MRALCGWGGLAVSVITMAACSSGPPSPGPGGAQGASSGSSSGSTSGSDSEGDAGRSGDASSGSPNDASASSGMADPGPLVTYGKAYADGQYNLGPVDWDETQWHNACAPESKYAPVIRQDEGTLLAGLWDGIPGVEDYCDSCITVTTGTGKTAILRVVTYGSSTTDSIDVSPEAFTLLNTGEYPRAMTWQFARCPDTGKMVYEFKSRSSQWWTSFWVRNARVPITKVEVKSANHAYTAVVREKDGSLTDSGGFGMGPFSIRVTGMDGTQVVDSFAWPAAGIGSAMLEGAGNF